MKIKFGEGKYDNTVQKVRSMTNAKHALTIVLGGDRGDGFSIHIGGVTREERIENTKRMIVAVAHLGRALVAGIELLTKQTLDQIKDDLIVEAAEFEMQPSPDRCPHCGANLPVPDAN